MQRRQITALFVSAFPVFTVSAVQAQQTNSNVQQVEVQAKTQPADHKTDSAGKAVYTRQELLQFGDLNVSEALRRLPGITVSGTEIRLRGLGSGYTQILLNGEPVAPGFSIDSLSPELIEKIEILRSGSAEYSAQGIAGTINIVLRKQTAQKGLSLRASLQSAPQWHLPQAGLEWTTGSGAWQGGLNAVVKQTRNEIRLRITEQQATLQGKPLAERWFDEQDFFRTNTISLAPRLNWKGDNGNQVQTQHLIEYSENHMHGGNHETTLLGEHSSYPDTAFRSQASVRNWQSDIQASQRLDENTRLEGKLLLRYNRRDSDYFFDGDAPAPQTSLRREVLSYALDKTLSTSGKYKRKAGEAHSLVLGWDGAMIQRAEQRLQLDQTPPVAGQSMLDENYHADIRRLALFAQDEWDISDRLQTYLGLRWEGLKTDVSGNALPAVRNRSSVFSPVSQWLWKVSEDKQDQLRLAISRTYKAPSTRDLVPRRYTVNNANSPANADFQGNPALLPELAWGLDLGWEKTLTKDSYLNLSGYLRRIDNVTTFQLFRFGDEWVSMPANQGKAHVRGIEIDTRLSLERWNTALRGTQLKFNLNRNWSEVDSVPGPNNRLVRQTPLSLNAGMDFVLSDTMRAGWNLQFQRNGKIRPSEKLDTYIGTSKVLDAYWNWKIDKQTQLKLFAGNLLHPQVVTGEGYHDAYLLYRQSEERTYRTFRLQWEQQF